MVVNADGSRRLQRSELGDLSGIEAKGADFLVSSAVIAAEDPEFVFQAGDEIERTNATGLPETFVVFPRVGQRCYDDSRRGMVRVYGVAAESLTPVVVTLANGSAPFTVPAVMGPIIGATEFGETGQESRLLTTVAYISRHEFTAKNVTEPPMFAAFEFGGMSKWLIELAQTDWGKGLVKIGLQRKTLAREFQGRRNATV